MSTQTQTIEARRAQLNILVTRPYEFLTDNYTRRVFGPAIVVRYGFSQIEPDDPLIPPGAPIGRGFPATHEVWDPDAINNLNQRGAFRNVYPVAAMRAFIAELREHWGPLHVQDNSGLLPDLHQGLWDYVTPRRDIPPRLTAD